MGSLPGAFPIFCVIDGDTLSQCVGAPWVNPCKCQVHDASCYSRLGSQDNG